MTLQEAIRRSLSPPPAPLRTASQVDVVGSTQGPFGQGLTPEALEAITLGTRTAPPTGVARDAWAGRPPGVADPAVQGPWSTFAQAHPYAARMVDRVEANSTLPPGTLGQVDQLAPRTVQINPHRSSIGPTLRHEMTHVGDFANLRGRHRPIIQTLEQRGGRATLEELPPNDQQALRQALSDRVTGEEKGFGVEAGSALARYRPEARTYDAFRQALERAQTEEALLRVLGRSR